MGIGMFMFVIALSATDIPMTCKKVNGVSHCTLKEETLDALIQHNDEVTSKLRKLEDDIQRAIPQKKLPEWTRT